MRGYLYILSNNSMPNLFKIGFTNRTIKDRIRELSSTGVPGSFEVEFFAEVDDAYSLERTVHNKLSRHRYDKEFFRCELRTADRVAKESIMENGYDILSHGGKGSSAFLTQTELLKMQRAAEEQKLKQAAALIERHRIEAAERQRQITEAIEKEKRDDRAAFFEGKFKVLALIVEQTIRSKSILG
jgi:hypothetical protein